MNKHQELLNLAKITYSDSVMQIVNSLHSQGFWRVVLAFGSYEDSWDSVFFAETSIALKFLNCSEPNYDELIESHRDRLVRLPNGVASQVYDAVHEMFDDRTVRN